MSIPPAAIVHTVAGAPVQVVNRFDFSLDQPLDKAAPLFGPVAERAWAGPEWNPSFLYPKPARDVEGAVFSVAHGAAKAVWVNTIFDTARGRMQYVYFIPDLMVTVIDVAMTPLGANSTAVAVTYRRTSLNPAANDYVNEAGKRDAANGPEWKAQIDAAFKPGAMTRR